jgi:hypothetical protein
VQDLKAGPDEKALAEPALIAPKVVVTLGEQAYRAVTAGLSTSIPRTLRNGRHHRHCGRTLWAAHPPCNLLILNGGQGQNRRALHTAVHATAWHPTESAFCRLTFVIDKITGRDDAFFEVYEACVFASWRSEQPL